MQRWKRSFVDARAPVQQKHRHGEQERVVEPTVSVPGQPNQWRFILTVLRGLDRREFFANLMALMESVMASKKTIVSRKNTFEKTIPSRRTPLELATYYFSCCGWSLLPTSEGLILCHESDEELYYEFDSMRSLWRWWRDVYSARRQFLAVLEQASSRAREGHAPSVALIEWLAARDLPCPPMMAEAYHCIWPHRTPRGWLKHALALEDIWTPGVDPLDIALDMTRKFIAETHAYD